MRFLILTSLLSTSVFSQVEQLHYSVIHPKTKLDFQWNGKALTVKDRTANFTIPYNECTRQRVDEFLAMDKAIWKNIPASGPDSVIVIKNGKKMSVARGSELGGHLLSLRDKLRFLSALVGKSCK